MNIGETIRSFRVERGMSQGDIERTSQNKPIYPKHDARVEV